MKQGKSREETKIQRAIQADLGAEPDLLLMRNTVGVAVFDGGARVTYGLGVGTPDLVAALRLGQAIAVWVALEVKVPGEEPDEEQRRMHDVWRRFGIQVFVVHSVEEARAALEIARGVAISEACLFVTGGAR